MKKFNANGVFRKDTKKEFNEHDLNSYNGKSLEQTKEELDDTIVFTEEDLEEVRAGMTLTEEEKEELVSKHR